MDIELRGAEQRADARTLLTLHERLVLSALVAGVTLWIRVVEVIPDGRRR
ncbi:MAG: hypothetical protein M3Q30_19820 [Actinomycetota bacterium]|nr:hypothetical protein [Actinomycetota bacterium]